MKQHHRSTQHRAWPGESSQQIIHHLRITYNVSQSVGQQLESIPFPHLKKFYLCYLLFGCAWSSLLHGLLSGCSEQGLLSSCGVKASYCSGFPCCRAQALGTQASTAVARRLQSMGSGVKAQGLSCPTACAILPGQGSNMSSALAGGFLTSGPPGSPPFPHFKGPFSSL